MFTLPAWADGGDRILADLKEGVLTLLLPKTPELQLTRIEAKVAEHSKSS